MPSTAGMDEQRFDTLTRRLATGTTRRTALRGLLGGGALALLGAHGASAKPPKTGGGGGGTKPPKTGGNSGCKVNTDCPEDGNPCTASVCDGGTGQCTQVAVVYGVQCGANGVCTGTGECYSCDFVQGPGLEGAGGGAGKVCPTTTTPGGYGCFLKSDACPAV